MTLQEAHEKISALHCINFCCRERKKKRETRQNKFSLMEVHIPEVGRDYFG